MKGIRPAGLVAVGVLGAVVSFVGFAGAETIKCQRTIAKAGSQYVQARAKVLAKCEVAKVAGKLPLATVCVTETKTAAAIGKALAKLEGAVDKACGGPDKVCGGGNDDTTASIGWSQRCPNIEGSSCTNSLGPGCEGIADCLACIHSTAVDRNISLFAGDLLVQPMPILDQALNKCHQAIIKASQSHLTSQAKILQKCWDARFTQKHSESCPSPGDGKAVAALAKADNKHMNAICQACGGTDKVCGGAADFTRADIGFTASCPSVTIPGGASCAGAVDSLASIVACLECITDFKTTCMDRAQVPVFEPLPFECNALYPTPTPTHTPCPIPSPTPGACPGSVSVTIDGPGADLDSGWTGLAHDFSIPTDNRLTLALGGNCSSGTQPDCGECTVNGPIANGDGPTFANQRCAGSGSFVQCTNDNDCTNAGVSGPCIFFFGAPVPTSAGGVQVCVTNEIDGPVTGTINIDDGTSEMVVKLRARAFLGITPARPCPICEAGLCSDGPRAGLPCTVNGVSQYFAGSPLSLDCLPPSGSSAGQLAISLRLGTDLQSKALAATSPGCRQFGYTSLKCMCDTCNSAAAEPCSSDAECPISGGNPGVCGGKRCQSGDNNGLPCTTVADCPNGQCGIPGQPTQPNACTDAVCSPNPFDEGSVDEGSCEAGPTDSFCSLERYRSCLTDAHCNPSEDCTNCIPGQICLSALRPCFTDNGRVGRRCYGGTNDPATATCVTIADCPDTSLGTFCGGGELTVGGIPDPGCGSFAVPKLGALFCSPPTTVPVANVAGGIPGPGRLTTSATFMYAP